MTPDKEEGPDKLQRFWMREIERANKLFTTGQNGAKPFWETADKIYKLYAKQSEASDYRRQFAMLWANTEVLKPSVYARPPIPQVSRRFKDKDPVGRLAAEMLERASSFQFESMEIDAILRHVRDDLLLPGRGVAWVRFDAKIDEMSQAVTDEKVLVDYIHYRQFIHGPARTWAEVPWVGKITYMEDEDGKARFGEAWKGVQLDHKAEQESAEDPQLTRSQTAKATVYEIWDKKSRKVIFLAKSANSPLAVEEPFLRFDNFFPCPQPVFSTLTTNNLIPTPDYKFYQDQADEINQLTDRIANLTDGLKNVVFYPKGAEGDISRALERAMEPGVENVAIGINSWASFTERGGSQQLVTLPIAERAEVIKACVELRNQLIQDTYQITGISDILRGQTDSSETATAQSIKAQWGSVRIRDRQQEMARFARDLTRLTCEIVAEQFSPETILAMSNMQLPQAPQMPPPAQMTGDPAQDQQIQQQMAQAQEQMQAYQAEMQKYQDAFALLKDEKLRGFRIDIETDSTIQPDEDAEKQRRTEFVTAVGSIMQQAAPLLLQAPELAPLVQETLLFTARGFRAGRGLEDAIEQAMTSLQQRITQQQQQQPSDPNEVKTKQAEAELEHAEKRNEMELGFMREKNGLEIQAMQQKTAAQAQAATQQAQIKSVNMQQEGNLRREMAEQEGELDAHMAQQSHAQGLNQTREKMREELLREMMEGNA